MLWIAASSVSGPINLAAVDEFRQQSERKVYLDAQDAELRDALETLESAIRKSIAKRAPAFGRPSTRSTAPSRSCSPNCSAAVGRAWN